MAAFLFSCASARASLMSMLAHWHGLLGHRTGSEPSLMLHLRLPPAPRSQHVCCGKSSVLLLQVTAKPRREAVGGLVPLAAQAVKHNAWRDCAQFCCGRFSSKSPDWIFIMLFFPAVHKIHIGIFYGRASKFYHSPGTATAARKGYPHQSPSPPANSFLYWKLILPLN